MSDTRLELIDSIVDVVTKLGEGNPGALNVCMQMIEKGQNIDPDSFMGNLTGLLNLDSNNIYGSRIWMLYKDVCEEDIKLTLGMLRAVQLGIISKEALSFAIDNRGKDLNVLETFAKVQEQLPEFGKV